MINEPLYDIERVKCIEPQVFNLRSGSSLSIFEVPQDNSIGTNDMNNAITLLSFHNNKIRYDHYFKNAVEDVEGGGEYIPVVSKNVIGFGQTRRFLLYDFDHHTYNNYRIVRSIDKNIEKVAIADAKKRKFVFEIESHNPKSDDAWDYTTQLLWFDLSGNEAKLIKNISICNGVTWSVALGKIFTYDIGKDELSVLNTDFEPDHHPLADIDSNNKGKISFTRLYPHSNLPFAILGAGRKYEVLVSWGQGREKAAITIFGDNAISRNFSFSPDGKWVVFTEGGVMDHPKKTYIMPISERYPNYLGSPIKLLNDSFNANNFGWTTNPISFVGSSLNKLYRWELTNAAHPESDKATFHDYIVEHDLEKLTKEKRQGLGGSQK